MFQQPRLRFAILAMTALAAANPALAQTQPSSTDLSEMRAAIDALKAEQLRAQARITELESALTRAQTTPAPVTNVTAAATTPPPSAFSASGDVRVRYEGNFGDSDARNRDRSVLRARVRAVYAVNDWLSVGGQVATGDNDDPNSTDITLSNFNDDLTASLDQAYIRLASGGFQADLGKIAQPFVRTELVWDGDVSPQGIAASYTLPLNGGAKLKATGLYFLIDEAVAGPDSDMAGVQAGFETSSKSAVKVEAAAAYYDYSLRSTAGGDTGDFRSNRFAGGRYLSDFNILDVIGAVTFKTGADAWPIRVVGDYVHNFGALNGDEHGFGLDVIAGRATERGDWRFTYGYAQTQPDAVFAAFSQDNTNIATNYLQHTLATDYMISRNVLLNATFYHYRPKEAALAGANMPRDWLDRVRLNLMATF